MSKLNMRFDALHAPTLDAVVTILRARARSLNGFKWDDGATELRQKANLFAKWSRERKSKKVSP